DDERPVDLKSTADIAARIYLHEATFDMELGQLSSPDEIYLTGPQVAFRGTGLRVDLNRIKHRLDRLLVRRGEVLRLHPLEKRAKPPQEAITPDKSGPSAKSRPAGGHAANRIATRPAQPVRYYRARFLGQVHVTIADEKATLDADELDVIFSEQA